MIRDARIDGGNPFDWGRTSEDYARWRDVYPPEFYAAVLAAGIGTNGQTVLDLGTGTGVLPRNLHVHGARFVAADVAKNQIAQAKRLSKEAGIEDIEYIVCAAEEVDFPDGTFDAAMACQCFHYMDVPRLMPRLHRMLKPGGRFGIFHMNWLPQESAIAAASEALVLEQNPAWGGKNWTRDQRQTAPWAKTYGFCIVQDDGFDVAVPFTQESWNGRIKACRGVETSLSEKQVAAFEAKHVQMLQENAPEEFTIWHGVTMLVLEKEA